MFALALSTWRKRFRSEYGSKWEEKSKVKERHTEKEQSKEQRGNEKQSTAHCGWHEDDMSARYTDTFSGSSGAMWCTVQEKNDV